MSDTAPSGLEDLDVIDLTEPSSNGQGPPLSEILFVDETPTSLIPKMGEFAVSNSSFYESLIITELGHDSDAVDVTERLDPFDRSKDAGADRPALGVLLTFEQGWRQEGLALGELRHSLSLAPGEVTQVAVVDWRRDTRTSSSAATSQAEFLTAQADGKQSVDAVTHSVARQSRAGTALNIGSSIHAQAGGSFGGLLGGASASGGMSSQMGLSATSSTGSRDVTSTARKGIQRSTNEASQALRSRRSTSVQEVSQKETQSTTTRVVANYNHMHAMTMQYFEVLQIYSLSTEVVKAERCVFLPMQVFEFTVDNLADKPAVVELIRRVLGDFGATALIESLDRFEEKADDLRTQLKDLRDARGDADRQAQDAWNQISAVLSAGLAKWPEGELAPPTLVEVKDFVNVIALTGQEPSRSDLFGAQLDVLQHLIDEDAIEEAMEMLLAANLQLKELDRQISGVRTALPRHEKLFEVLQDHQLFLNQQMWMRMEQHHWHQLVLGRSYDGQTLGGLVDPAPIGYFGNYVAFRWDFAANDEDGRKEFERAYVKNRGRDVQSRVALPTEGVFGEAVLGQSNSAERIDLTRFWNWQDSPIPILPPAIAPVSSASRARDVSFGDLDLAAAVVRLQEQQLWTDNTGNQEAVAALQSALLGSSGLSEAASAAASAGKNAAAGAADAQKGALQASKQVQDFVVGIANSEVGKIAANAAIGAATGGVSTVGGLVNTAVKIGGKAAVSKATAAVTKKTTPAAP